MPLSVIFSIEQTKQKKKKSSVWHIFFKKKYRPCIQFVVACYNLNWWIVFSWDLFSTFHDLESIKLLKNSKAFSCPFRQITMLWRKCANLISFMFAAPEQYARCGDLDDQWRQTYCVLPMSRTLGAVVNQPRVQRQILRQAGDHQPCGKCQYRTADTVASSRPSFWW